MDRELTADDLVAGTIQPDDEPIADQLVLPDAFEGADVFDPNGPSRGRTQHHKEQCGADIEFHIRHSDCVL